jgi:hypothetical protein
MAKLDHTIVRPLTPSFDPSTEKEWMKAVEACVLENGDGSTHDRLQAAMTLDARVHESSSQAEEKEQALAHATFYMSRGPSIGDPQAPPEFVHATTYTGT